MNKNLNDIIPPSRRRMLEGAENVPAYPANDDLPPVSDRPTYQRPMPSPRGGKRFPYATAAVALVVIAVSVGALFAFSGAKVSVQATENATSVTGEFIATLSEGLLPFEMVSVEKVTSVSVPSEGTETVTQAAQGTITITNQQDAPQQLIKNTRFQTPDGLIFRIRDSVTVPAAKNGTPGTLETTVYADAAGENYNIGPSSFTLPGLSGSATFTLVTAKSSAAMRGGFNGPRPSVGQATRDAKAAEVRAKLTPEIEEELAAAVPEGYVLIPGASRITYETQPDQAGAGGTVEISEKASAVAIVFPKEALAQNIAYQVVGSYSGQPVTLKDASGLTVTPVGDLPAVGATEFAFSLAGNTTILWKVDTSKIAAAVAGKNRDSAETILSGFPEVEKATLVLRPFWKTSFPADPSKIDVTVDNSPSAP